MESGQCSGGRAPTFAHEAVSRRAVAQGAVQGRRALARQRLAREPRGLRLSLCFHRVAGEGARSPCRRSEDRPADRIFQQTIGRSPSRSTTAMPRSGVLSPRRALSAHLVALFHLPEERRIDRGRADPDRACWRSAAANAASAPKSHRRLSCFRRGGPRSAGVERISTATSGASRIFALPFGVPRSFSPEHVEELRPWPLVIGHRTAAFHATRAAAGRCRARRDGAATGTAGAHRPARAAHRVFRRREPSRAAEKCAFPLIFCLT